MSPIETLARYRAEGACQQGKLETCDTHYSEMAGDAPACYAVMYAAWEVVSTPGAAVVTTESLTAAMWDALEAIGHIDVDVRRSRRRLRREVDPRFAAAITEALRK